MPLWVWLGIGGLILFVFGGVAPWALLRPDGKPTLPDDRGRMGGPERKLPPPPPGWVRFSPPGDFLSVAFPGKPALNVIPIKVGASTVDQPQYTVKEGRHTYAVSYVEFPGQVFTEKDLDASVGNITQGLMNPLKNPKLIAQKRIKLDGFPGVESEVEGEQNKEQMHYFSRFYLAQHRMITLLVMVPPEDAGSEKVRMFFDSFRLNP
jgi:hypothetical protein